MAIMQYMDEILIEEKKYVSSKQAAKMTGYAKDYIGQLCREGRVPARLVGRSWYVLESAIQDHRFGNQEAEMHPVQPSSATSLTQTWESTRYESSNTETLPSLNLLQKAEMASEAEKEEEHDAVQLSQLHDSWRAWFDHVEDASAPIEESVQAPVLTAAIGEKEEKSVERTGEEVTVPLHIVAEKRSLREVLPIEKVKVVEKKEEVIVQVNHEDREEIRRGVSISSLVHAFVVLIAVISGSLAAAGSGYFDSFFISNSQAAVISGISVVNK
jgi:hypothetical protein